MQKYTTTAFFLGVAVGIVVMLIMNHFANTEAEAGRRHVASTVLQQCEVVQDKYGVLIALSCNTKH